MFYSDCIMLKLWTNNHDQTSNFIWLSQRGFWLEVANKKSLAPQNLSLLKVKFPLKKAYFFTTTKFCIPGRKYVVYNIGNMLFAVLKNKLIKNHIKLVLKTWYFLNHLQFTNVSKIKGIIVIKVWLYLMLYNLFIHALLYVLIHWCTFLKERKASLYFIH